MENKKTYPTKENGINTKLYALYITMKRRCYDPRHREYRLFGERGVKVCDEWLNDFQTFAAYVDSMGYMPSRHTLIPIINRKEYGPGNVKLGRTPDVLSFSHKNLSYFPLKPLNKKPK